MKATPKFLEQALQRASIRSLKRSSMATAMTAVLLAGPAFADDTEVFFGQVDASADTQPNVMFVLDTSGSMNWNDGQPLTRLERMKNAIITILDSSANVNVGIMRFNGSSGGGSVLYPVTPIDSTVCEADNCGDLHLIKRLAEGDDDAEENLDNNNVYLGSSHLNLGENNSGDETLVGMRFTDINIPQGVDLTNAKIEFTAASNFSGSSVLTFRAELVPSASGFTSNNGDLSGRNETSQYVEWTVPAWSSNKVYQTPDLTPILQPLIDQADWCGGNSIAIGVVGFGKRIAKSHNQSPNQSPALKISYDSTSVDSTGGCTLNTVVSQVRSGSDDAEQYVNSGWVERDSSDLEFTRDGSTQQMIGMRFRDIAIPQGATIESANIEFEVDKNRSGDITVRFFGHDRNSSYQFREKYNHISNRTLTTASTDWAIPVAAQNAKVNSPDLKDIVQEIVDRGGWNSGNSMAFIVKHVSGNGYREFESYNGESVAAPKLRITYYGSSAGTTTTPSYVTARDKLKQVVTGMTATGGTPVVDAFYEAANYYLGREVDYGKKRGHYTNRYHRVSTPLSYANGSVSRSAGCTDEDLDHSDCKSETITGTPTYVPPYASSCQTNHIVLLSDGSATSNSAANKVKSLTGQSSCDNGNWKESCGKELAEYLEAGDFSSFDGDQNVTTYTIGFNNNDPFLTELAHAGGGTYNTANSSAELVNVFQSILSDVLAVDTAFVAPAATVNQFNRLTHNSSIYFALFKPNTRPTWSGNLKQYRLDSDDNGGVIIRDFDTSSDPRGKPAIDAGTGFFASDAVSAWSDVTDGNSVTAGGAAEQLPEISRNAYTFTGDVSNIPAAGANLTLTSNALHEGNGYITDEMLAINDRPDASERAAYRSGLLKWIRGVDINDEDGDGDNTDLRAHMGDPMHARPVILNYANTADTIHSTIFAATNEGFLHAIDAQSDLGNTSTGGNELWAFMPQELLSNVQDNFDNVGSVKHPYGLDGALATWTDDANDNVRIDSGEEAYVYVGMRRGGNNLYALDVSNRLSPKLKWVIHGGSGGTPGFEELAQSWSRPVPAKIIFNGAERQVLIFTAGYDTNQDPDDTGLVTPRVPDSRGRGIFIVDARTGAKVWSALGTTGGNQLFADMDYSFPSDIRVIDIDFDGYTDQMYVGDTGGQIWRFDVTQHHQSGDLLKGGVIAKLGGDDLQDNRRFYYEPDVALINESGERFLSIAIGSGWRAHPLAESNTDRFYMIRSNHIYGAPEDYGKDYGKEVSPGVWAPITDDDLVDVTTNIEPVTNTYGWRMDLPYYAEKVLGDAITINNQIIFTTYRPDDNVAACSTAIGSGGVYVVDVVDASPTLDLDGDGDIDINDREKPLKHGGIPPEATALIVEADDQIKPTILVGTEQPINPEFGNMTRRSYWVDLGNDTN
ncbi:MAG: VWA domain-containing protein [Gammaproteobacteria bacterium]|nr:VWA domain-containing protein [Gammaproteobacteria bacterium]